MDNSTRVTALDFARGLNQVRDPYELIAAADLIEDYIRAGNTVPKTTGKLDFDANLREALSPDEYNWSGFAAELIKACNSGNVLVVKPRQSGMTRLMAEYFAHQTRQHGRSLLWLTPRGNGCKDIEHLLEGLGADMTLVSVSTYRNLETRNRGRGFDFVYADELAYLPFADDDSFLAILMPMGKRFIFASTPNQPKGVFYDLWENSYSFYKFRITWDMSLMEVTRDRLERKEVLSAQMGSKTFKASYMADFVPEEKKPETLNVNNDPNQNGGYVYWTANTTGTAPAPVHTGGGYVYWPTSGTVPPAQGWTSATTSTATVPGNLRFEPVDPSTLDSMVQKLSDEPVKKAKKPRRKKGASFNDEDYIDPVG